MKGGGLADVSRCFTCTYRSIYTYIRHHLHPTFKHQSQQLVEFHHTCNTFTYTMLNSGQNNNVAEV